MVKINGIIITSETTAKAREHFARIYRACINDALNGNVKVQDVASYVNWQAQCEKDMLQGINDHTKTFLQMAFYIQTGECVGILAR